MLDGLLLLLLFQFLGEMLVPFTGLPVPGPVAGMVLLLVAPLVRAQALERIAPAAPALGSNLVRLFCPIAIGRGLAWERDEGHGLALLVSVVGGTVIAMVLITLLLKWLLRRAPT